MKLEGMSANIILIKTEGQTHQEGQKRPFITSGNMRL
jgi:hypothetical protein